MTTILGLPTYEIVFNLESKTLEKKEFQKHL